MAEQTNEGAVYKVTVIDDKGTPLVAYVNEASRQSYARFMREEYGNAKVEQISIDEIPEGISFDNE
jgi:hypothetical protein